MSFMFMVPELVESAAQDLVGLRWGINEATAAAAAPTTGILAAGADEVSAAISALFSAHGQEFQAVSAQVEAFHDEFVGLLSAGTSAYANAEAAGARTLLNAVNPPAEALLGAPLIGTGTAAARALASSAAALAPGSIQAELQSISATISNAPAALGTFGATIAGPYQTLLTNTVANLQSLGSAVAANPAPFLHQFITNQLGYGQLAATAVHNAVTNFPAVLANAPANIQAAFRALATADPTAFIHQVITNQMGFAQTVATSLQSAAHDFNTGWQALPTAYQTAYQQFMAGNVNGAVDTLGSGFGKLFITGFDVSVGPIDPACDPPLLTITPTGTLGDLLPIFAIPGQMAQNLTNLIPASIPAQMAQNATNVIKAFTNTSLTSVLQPFADPTSPIGLGIVIDANMGLPLALAIDGLGGPISGLNALGSSVSTFVNAVHTGNALGALGVALDAPAVVANGFLNGQMTFPLTIDVVGIPTTLNLPFSGILVPPGTYSAVEDLTGLGLGPLFLNSTVTGTPLGGIVPGLLDFLPEQLAVAIGAPAPAGSLAS